MANELQLGRSPIVVGSLSADPGTAYNGEIYYSTSANTFRIYQNGGWTSIGTGGSSANTFLSNLSSPVAVNQDMTPGTDATFKVGTQTFSWLSGNIQSLLDSAGSVSVGAYSRVLDDSGGFVSLDWQNRTLKDGAAAIQLSWSTSGVEFNQLTASTVPYLGAGKVLVSSAVTPTQLGYLSGASGTTGTGNLVFSASPTLTGTLTAAAASLSGTLNMNGGMITNLATPTSLSSASQAATKGYVDNAINGVHWKDAVVVATTTTLPAYTFAAGGGPEGTGDTLTANAVGALVIDGHTTVLNDRILVKNEAGGNAPYNGIWYVSTVGGGSNAYVLTRAPDMVLWVEVPAAAVFVQTGSVNADIGWVCTSMPGGTMDTTAITFVQFSSAGAYTAGAGLNLSSGQFNVLYDNSTIGLNGGNEIYVLNAGITETQIASSALSSTGALAGGSGTKLSVKVDGSTVGINGSDQLYIPNGAITDSKVNATAAIQISKLLAPDANRVILSNNAAALADSSTTSPQLVANKLLFGPTPGSYLEEQYADITLANNTSGVANVDASTSFAVASYGGFIADYYMTDGGSPTIVRQGRLSCVANSDGSIPSITDTYNDSGDIGVQFSLAYSAGSANLQFTSTNTTDRTLRIFIKRFLR
jgi:hypothetical protein